MARRERIGAGLAALFTLSGHIVIIGLLVAPRRIEPAAVLGAAVAGAALWMVAQLWLWRALRALSDPRRGAHLQTCYDLADDAWQAQRLEDARGALNVALTVDDENPHTYARIARLSARLGRREDARRAWRRVGQLDRRREYRLEMQAAMDELTAARSTKGSLSSGTGRPG